MTKSKVFHIIGIFVLTALLIQSPLLLQLHEFRITFSTDIFAQNQLRILASPITRSSWALMDPNLQWNRTFGGTGHDQAEAVVECYDGGFAFVGNLRSLAWLVRTDQNGNHLWNHTYTGPLSYSIEGLVECADHGFAITGSAYNETANDSDAWLLRTDALGNHLWNYTYGGSDWDIAHDIIACSAGGFALIGHAYSYEYWASIWLVRIAADGTHLWNRTYSDNSEGYVLVEDSGGNGFALAGTYFQVEDPYDDSHYDWWLLRTDNTGAPLWNQTYGGPDSNEVAYGLVQCSDSGYALTGQAYVTGEIGWLVRTNSGGTMLWNSSYDAYCYSLVEVSSGGFAITGQKSDDLWVERTDSLGYHLWQGYYGAGSNIYSRTGNSIIECSTGGFVMAGRYRQHYGNHEDAYLVRISDSDPEPPTWVEPPEDQFGDQGVPFRYDLNATDPAGLDIWWLNDTTQFTVDNQGVITNTVDLSSGEYIIRVNVNDTFGNTLTGGFELFVRSAIPGFPVSAILIGVVTGLSVVLLHRRRKWRREN